MNFIKFIFYVYFTLVIIDLWYQCVMFLANPSRSIYCSPDAWLSSFKANWFNEERLVLTSSRWHESVFWGDDIIIPHVNIFPRVSGQSVSWWRRRGRSPTPSSSGVCSGPLWSSAPSMWTRPTRGTSSHLTCATA